jgi:hypothetical protein
MVGGYEVVELAVAEQAFLGGVTSAHRFPLPMVNSTSTCGSYRSASNIGQFSTAFLFAFHGSIRLPKPTNRPGQFGNACKGCKQKSSSGEPVPGQSPIPPIHRVDGMIEQLAVVEIRNFVDCQVTGESND